MKRHLFWILLLVALAVAGITAGAVMASENRTSTAPDNGKVTHPSGNSLISRVAAILGLDEADVQTAFNQASSEIQDENLKRKLDRLVEREWLTQEQADEVEAWFKARPEALSQLTPFNKFRFGRGLSHYNGHPSQHTLDHLVEKGRLTQGQADEITAWLEARPESAFPGVHSGGLKGHGWFPGLKFGGHDGPGTRFHKETPSTSILEKLEMEPF